MPKTIKQSLASKDEGYHVGNRLILPFRCQILKLIVNKDIYYEFVGNKHIKISQDPKNTSVYFRQIGDLDSFINSYKVIKLVVAEWDADLCDMERHVKVVCEMKEDHVVDIHEPEPGMLFIE